MKIKHYHIVRHYEICKYKCKNTIKNNEIKLDKSSYCKFKITWVYGYIDTYHYSVSQTEPFVRGLLWGKLTSFTKLRTTWQYIELYSKKSFICPPTPTPLLSNPHPHPTPQNFILVSFATDCQDFRAIPHHIINLFSKSVKNLNFFGCKITGFRYGTSLSTKNSQN